MADKYGPWAPTGLGRVRIEVWQLDGRIQYVIDEQQAHDRQIYMEVRTWLEDDGDLVKEIVFRRKTRTVSSSTAAGGRSTPPAAGGG